MKRKFMTAIMCTIAFTILAFTDADGRVFRFMTGSYNGVELSYRKAVLNSNGAEKPALFIYMHGGSSKGNDNIVQLAEQGVDSIYNFIINQNKNAVFIVPQCPADKSWGGAMNAVLKALIDEQVSTANVDTDKMYIFGGSMGGTSTWGLLSAYPGLFTAAMPVAGNPSKCDAEAVAKTPVYTVMGTADTIMKINAVEAFLNNMDDYGADYKFDIEDGWTHEMTCIQSYTTERLLWVVGHVKGDASVEEIVMPKEVTEVKYYTLQGIEVRNLEPSNVYIRVKKYADDSVNADKVVIR